MRAIAQLTKRGLSMVTRYVIGIVFWGVGLLALASCDSSEVAESTSPQGKAVPIQSGSPEFALLRKSLDSSLIPNSIDDIFVKLTDRFDGFGGVYENEEGNLVIISSNPENTRAAQNELVSELFEMTETNDGLRNSYLSKEIKIQQGTYTFTDLAVYRDIIEKELLEAIPIVLTDVDERQNVVLIGLDENSNTSTTEVLSKVAQLGIPPEAIAFEHMAMPMLVIGGLPELEPRKTTMLPTLRNYVRPLAGGLQIDRPGACTLGIPVWYGSPGNQTRGFLTASHCTAFVGINNNSQWGQPLISSLIGAEQEDPPLINCGPGSSNCQLRDAALIDLNSAHDNSSNTLPGRVYLTDFSSSTGAGGLNVTGEKVSLTTQSPFVGLDVNKVGRTTGWTTGEIVSTCVNTVTLVRHPDNVERITRLTCYIRANTPLNGGDSGSALFSIINDPDPSDVGGFFGILSACLPCIGGGCCTNPHSAFYVPWASIDQAMTTNITLYEDQGGE
jgi:hypothetical protein